MLRTYLLRVVTAALLCAAVSAVCPKGKKEILHFCCACVLALVVLSPLTRTEIRLPDWTFEAQTSDAAAQAQERAQETLRAETERALAAEAERYAAEQGLTVRAVVSCAVEQDEYGVCAVTLEGERDDRFAALLAQRFGVGEADIVWRE